MNNQRPYHPLRPDEDFILVCEGITDLTLLENIILLFVPDNNLNIISANGVENIRALRGIFSPAISIADRDFDNFPDEVQKLWNQQTNALYWVRHDIEAYLLYPDWLWQLIKKISEGLHSYPKRFPKSEDEITQKTIEIATYLIPDHSGRHTIAWLKKITSHNDYRIEFNVDKQNIKGGGEFSSDEIWRKELMNYQQILINAPQKWANLTQIDVGKYYDDMVQIYSESAQSLETIRLYFSGKRILENLSQQWHIESRNNKKPVDILTGALVDIAINYAKQIPRLSDDPRLGDFGRLASKITSRDI